MCSISLKSLDNYSSSIKCVVDNPHTIYEYIFPTTRCSNFSSPSLLEIDFLKLIAKDYNHNLLKFELDNLFDCEGILKIIID